MENIEVPDFAMKTLWKTLQWQHEVFMQFNAIKEPKFVDFVFQ